ncbi:MAG: helix-turn-helix transcriptional regulator [Firmicutes bacterium]|nr:helix-turn-helix transcriptional regulator [Bacillota bacterium]
MPSFFCFFSDFCDILGTNPRKEVVLLLGPRIASLRRAAGMSQAELAQRLKISPSTVGMYEQGRREPALDTLAAMAEVFGVTIDFLVTGRAETGEEQAALDRLLLDRVTSADGRLDNRQARPFSRQELAVLFAAMLMEP